MKAENLLARCRPLLAFIKTFEADNHYAPTLREMGNAVGIRSTSVVTYRLRALARAGLVDLGPAGQPRSVVVLATPARRFIEPCPLCGCEVQHGSN